MQLPAQTSIAGRVEAIRSEVTRACDRVGRDPRVVTLIGITKTFTVDDIAEALDAGLDDFGENRAQELMPKLREAQARHLMPHWHFVGHLQRNKVREVLPYIAALHSLDSVRLAAEIERSSEREEARRLRCYLEVNVAGEGTKQGITPEAVGALLDAVGAYPHIEVAGLMTVAPHVPDAEQVRPVFRTLRELAHAHGLAGLSMGMSEDYTVAVEEGATAIRVGRALFGPRP
jgi:pyridoxal phosphate enzyme (YggS family)